MLHLNTLIKCVVNALEREAKEGRPNDQLVALLKELYKETEQDEARMADVHRLLSQVEAGLKKSG